MFNLELAWDRPARTAAGEARHVLRVRIIPQTSGKGMPLRMAIALDTSGSMKGAKLQHAKAACEAVASLLRQEDRLWMAGFSTAVTEILANEKGGAKLCERARSAIASLQASGITRTDLALNWIRDSLKPDANASRVGVLITDGHATDLKGKKLADLQPLVSQATDVGSSGITLCAVGMGDAAHFNTAFLTDLTDRGRGGFIYAPDPASLQEQLRGRLQIAQQSAAAQASVKVKTLRPGVKLGAMCRFRPEFCALETSGDSSEADYAIGALVSGQPTDVLLEVETPGLSFGERMGARDVVEITVEAGSASASAKGAIEWTNSLIAAQALNAEMDKDKHMWDVNLYASALQRTDDPARTGDILRLIAEAALKAGREDIANRATTDLDELKKKGVLPPDRRTKTIVSARNPGATS